jgi:hypothetical protein
MTVDSTFRAVVQFVQAGSGTGVHIGGGLILTCAHVVDAQDDDSLEEDEEPPQRVGRTKVVMFESGRTFLATCTAVQETADGHEDVALLQLHEDFEVNVGAHEEGVGFCLPPRADVASEGVTAGSRLFCVGNPSNIDLESLRSNAAIEFEPPAWHSSVGNCEGYLSVVLAQELAAQRERGRAPTRGERRKVAEASPVEEEDGVLMNHTCWTYWGHSGAPLFNEKGCVVGLHCSWDDSTGMRQAQKLCVLLAVLHKAGPVASTHGSVHHPAFLSAEGSASGGGSKRAEPRGGGGGTSKRKVQKNG